MLQRCKEINLTLNKDKCLFNQSEIQYIGHVISKNGVKPDPTKIEAILEMPPPTDKKGVERLLGTVNYLAKFVPNMSVINEPIRSLLRSDVLFIWEKPQQDAFEAIKDILSREPILTFFDVKKPVCVSVDASKCGLGAVITQDERPIAYASRSLTETEKRYAQIEKELLAVTFGLERFHQYTYGVNVTVENDHKPLENILRKPLVQTPPRLQRLLLRLQKYDFNFKYVPGKQLIIADTLSRAHLPPTKQQKEEICEEMETYVHSVFIPNIPISRNILQDIKKETANDAILSKAIRLVKSGWPENKNQLRKPLQEYWKLRSELTCVDNLLLMNERIVIPEVLQPEILRYLHVSHFGIEKTKARARTVVYWIGMNRDITDMVAKCHTCMDVRNKNPKEPLNPTPIPEGPWQVLGSDLFTLNNEDYLIVVDYYSKFFEVVKLENTRSKTVITHMKSMFARHGIPYEVRSDNGPQYSSREFKDFSRSWCFKHKTSSPCNPQGNGLAEKTVQTVKRMLEKARIDGKDPYISLLEYRNTPTDESPAKLLMSRQLRSILPITKNQLKPKVVPDDITRQKRKITQNRQKTYFDVGSRKLSSLSPGQRVRFRHRGQWQPGYVKDQVHTRSYNVEDQNGDQFRRNRRDIIQSKETSFKEPIVELDDEDEDAVRDKETSDPEVENLDTTEVEDARSPEIVQQVQPYKTRAGREVRRPKYLSEYV